MGLGRRRRARRVRSGRWSEKTGRASFAVEFFFAFASFSDLMFYEQLRVSIFFLSNLGRKVVEERRDDPLVTRDEDDASQFLYLARLLSALRVFDRPPYSVPFMRIL